MSAAIQHPTWCSPAHCDVHDGGVHNGERHEIAPAGLGWSSTVEVYPSWAPAQDGYPVEEPGVFVFASGEGPLTPAEARRLARALEATAALIEAGVRGEHR